LQQLRGLPKPFRVDSERKFCRARKADEGGRLARRGGLTQRGGICAGSRRKGFLEVPLRQTIPSAVLNGIFVLPSALRDRQVEVIILPAESNIQEKPKPKRQFDFVKGCPLPDSFFDPLPEEDLEAWGL
jgi:hypothetical protein